MNDSACIKRRLGTSSSVPLASVKWHIMIEEIEEIDVDYASPQALLVTTVSISDLELTTKPATDVALHNWLTGCQL